MPFNVNDFIAQTNKGGFAKTSHFDVQITPPSKLQSSLNTRELIYRCDSISTPNRTISTSDNFIYGVPEFMAYASNVQEITASVIVSQDLKEKEFFESWIDLIVGDYRKGRQHSNMFAIGFYDDYKGQVEVKLYSEDGKKKRTIKLIDAYPVAINGSGDLSWQDSQIMRISVPFKFKYYTEE